MIHGDATYGIPDGNHMVEFSYRIADEPDAGLVSRLVDASEVMTMRESEFLTHMESAGVVSPKQLYWLRDLVSKYEV